MLSSTAFALTTISRPIFIQDRSVQSTNLLLGSDQVVSLINGKRISNPSCWWSRSMVAGQASRKRSL